MTQGLGHSGDSELGNRKMNVAQGKPLEVVLNLYCTLESPGDRAYNADPQAPSTGSGLVGLG